MDDKELDGATEAARVIAEQEAGENVDATPEIEQDEDEDVPDAETEDAEATEKKTESESDQRLTQIAWRLLDSLSAIIKAEQYEPDHADDLRNMGKDLLVRGMQMAIALEELHERKQSAD